MTLGYYSSLIFQEIIDKYVPTYTLKERKKLYTTPEVFNLKRKKNKLWKSIVQLNLNMTCPTLSQLIMN